LRLFVGIALPPQARAALASCLSAPRVRALAPARLRWLPPENWHLTLQFLGAVQEDRVAALQTACQRAAQGCAPFEIELSGMGAFGSPRRARIVWVGVTRGHAEVAALAEALCAQTEPLGFAREQRAFRAHATLARLKTPARVESLLAAIELPKVAMPVSELTLFRSHTSSEGARYEPLASWPLALRARAGTT
jgi:2'-5' RNA ligase